ncbi:MAG TPA: EAL domain-containing protein [Streptosporangiaceae bacterium]|nr:EAL domain-containing protein [Streptosporangiaceae bacterium]
MLAWAAAWLVLAALACVRLLRAASQPERPVKNGYRWLAVATACVAGGATVQEAFGGLAGGAQPLRLADLISMAALPALAIGLATLTSRLAPAAGDTRTGRGMLIDSCLLAAALFVVLLVALFGPDYVPVEVGRAAFALALIRPVADLVVLGVVLRFVVRSASLTALPVLALTALVAADSLAVADRVAGQVPGLGSQLAVAAALALLALAPTRTPAFASPVVANTVIASTGDRPGSRGFAAMVSSPVTRLVRSDRAWSSPATVAALAATAVAAIVVTGFAVAGRPLLASPLAAAGSVVVLLLVARLAGLTRQATAVAEAAQESDWMFRALAGTTSDAVLICGRDGTIEYASQSVGEFGYAPTDLTGRRLSDIVHPEDRPAAIRAALTRLRATAGTAAFAGRVRGADGSWRYVESTLSRYGAADEPARLLITAQDVSDRVALRRRLTQLTYHDGLTGLPNRVYVEERVRDCDEHDLAGAILIDFDGYAAVNEIAGHASGDLVLAQAARRIRAAVPQAATVARWGGDEFAVLLGPDDLGSPATAQDVTELAERLAGLIAAEPFSVAGKEVALTASVGAAIASPNEAGLVLSHAETALAKAQDAGVGRVEIFAAAMHAEAERRLELAASLSLAIAGHELDVEYLPVIDLTSSKVRGVEAAPRWARGREPVAPAEFLAVAEESGLIVQLGRWLLREACRQVATWRAAGNEIGISVPCTARQVSEPGFGDLVLAALDEAGLPPESLTLEVTERVLTASSPPVAADLAGLRGKGIRLGLDCFGTGLVSLASLRNAAVDVVKIDASYVAGLEADPTLAALTRSIIQLGRDLGIEVVANGIERPEQRWRLESMGCEFGQGPGVAAPMPASEPDPPPTVQAVDTACTTAG